LLFFCQSLYWEEICIILWTFQNGQYENVEIKICIGLWEIGIGSEYLNWDWIVNIKIDTGQQISELILDSEYWNWYWTTNTKIDIG